MLLMSCNSIESCDKATEHLTLVSFKYAYSYTLLILPLTE